ncbi:hypothetical protein [Methanolobus sp.]|uniref:hypothetical protein n=1 Tax=Methanolobus sp. TaxID=1874737 RepID=UPI0025FC412E|nr:hypothetical protein [Methanolobus sp.]
MGSPTINELEENINKRRIFISLILVLFLGWIIIALYNPDYPYLLLITILLLISIVVISRYTPYISNVDIIQYHLIKLIESSKNNDVKKSQVHINKLAEAIYNTNIELGNNGLDSLFILNPARQILADFLKYLRHMCQYSTESNLNSWSASLEDISFAIGNKNIALLTDTIDKFIIQDRDIKSDVLFSYEKPSILERFMKEIMHLIKNNTRVNYVVKLTFVLFLLVGIAYFLSIKVSFITLDNYAMGVCLLAAVGIAQKI